MNWELISKENNSLTHRLSVPGGWIYRVTTYNQSGNYKDSKLIFIRETNDEVEVLTRSSLY